MSTEMRSNMLRTMEICRFCLDETGPLFNIFEQDSKFVPLPLQIMACVAIEVCKSTKIYIYTVSNNLIPTNEPFSKYISHRENQSNLNFTFSFNYFIINYYNLRPM